MIKYRIIEIQELDSTYYILQTRWCIFWWKTEVDSNVDDLGIYEFIRKFKTKEEAREFYIRYRVKPFKSTIVEIG